MRNRGLRRRAGVGASVLSAKVGPAYQDLRDVSDRAIDSRVKNLRHKLDAAVPGIDWIKSVYGIGYRNEP